MRPKRGLTFLLGNKPVTEVHSRQKNYLGCLQMSIESVSEGFIPDITIAETYYWHKEELSKNYSACFATGNPLYGMKAAAHLTGAALGWIPGVQKVVYVTSKHFISPDINSRLLRLLNCGDYQEGYNLLLKGADVSLRDQNEKTLVDILLDRVATKTAFEENIDLLLSAVRLGVPFDPFHTILPYIFKFAINKGHYDVCASLILGGVELRGHAQQLLQAFNRTKGVGALNLGVLGAYSTDLTQIASYGGYSYIEERNIEIKKISQIFGKKEKNIPLIYSERGIGKQTLIKGLAKLIAENRAPEFLKNRRILSINTHKLLSDLNSRAVDLKGIQKSLDSLKGKAIIFLGNLVYHQENAELQNALGGMGIQDVLSIFFESKDLFCVGTCSKNSASELEKNPYIQSLVTPYELTEPGKSETYAIVKNYLKVLEAFYEVRFDPECFEILLDLSKRYLPEAIYPLAPIEVLEQCALRVSKQKDFGPLKIQVLEERLTYLQGERDLLEKGEGRIDREKLEKTIIEIAQKEEEKNRLNQTVAEEIKLLDQKESIRKEILCILKLIEKLESPDLIERLIQKKEGWEERARSVEKRLEMMEPVYIREIGKELIAEVVSGLAGVPVSKLISSEKERLKLLESILKERVKGQDEAIKMVSDAIRRARLGLNGDNRPRGTFLFLGPTGVGKTELAKALAEELVGSESKMIRIDMSEYQNEVDVTRLIGSAPGYVGYQEGGRLTKALKKNPYTVVLIDELEKGHPVIADLFLQVFDDGRLTDGQGETVNCKEAVFIMTSNIGSDVYSLPKERQKKALERALKEKLRPEFINRIDEILQFNALDNKEVVREIAIHQLENLQGKISRLFDIEVSWTGEVIEDLVERGFSPLFGARPLRRLVEKDLMTLISNALLDEKLAEGSSITFNLKDGKIVLDLFSSAQ